MNDFSDAKNWIVQRTFNDVCRIRVKITKAELVKCCKTLRSILPEFSSLSSSEVYNLLKDSKEFTSEQVEGRRGVAYVSDLYESGIVAERVIDSCDSFLLICRKSNNALSLDDEQQNENIAKDLISRGAEVSHIEA